jgi:Cu/Ag efflux protein CusF
MINPTTVATLKDVIVSSNAVMQEMQSKMGPVQQQLTAAMDPFKNLDHTKAYFTINEDGSVTVIQFGPQGQPGYVDAIPFPADEATQ